MLPLRDVEAERAAVAAGVDGLAAGDPGAQHAGLGLDPDRAAGTGGGGLDPLQLGAGDGAVDGDDDLVGDRVGPPGGARDLRRALQLGGGGRLSSAAPRVT